MRSVRATMLLLVLVPATAQHDALLEPLGELEAVIDDFEPADFERPRRKRDRRNSQHQLSQQEKQESIKKQMDAAVALQMKQTNELKTLMGETQYKNFVTLRASAKKIAGHVRRKTSLLQHQNFILLRAYNSFLAVAKDKMNNVDAGLPVLRRVIKRSSFKKLREEATKGVPTFTLKELQRLYAYALFAKYVLGIPKAGKLYVDVRVEGWKAYVLVPIKDTVLKNVMRRSLTFVHDEDWANKRFLDCNDYVDWKNNTVNDCGLIGQFMGRSKFVTAFNGAFTSKEDALKQLGLKGYPDFDKPGTLYVVSVRGRPEVLMKARPMVPLLYNVGQAVDKDATTPEKWQPENHFQEGAMPGFTSGLKAELVIKTFRMKVPPKQRQRGNARMILNSKGVTINALGDQV